jgi:tetratricopeptide (TPR) repeat protein
LSERIRTPLLIVIAVLLVVLVVQSFRTSGQLQTLADATWASSVNQSTGDRRAEAAARVTEGSLLAKAGQYDAARVAFETALAVDPGHVPAVTGLELVRVRQLLDEPDAVRGDPAALRYAAMRFQVKPTDEVRSVDALVALGNVALFLEGDSDKARDLYTEALSTETTNLSARLGLTVIALSMARSPIEGLLDEVAPLLEQTEKPSRFAFETVARLALVNQKFEEAARYASRARALRQTPTNLSVLVQALLAADKPDEAAAAATTLVQLDPKNADAPAMLCQALLRTKRAESALPACRAAFEASKDVRNQLSLARAFAAANQVREAIDAYTGLLKRDDRQLGAWLEVAGLLRRQGDVRAAAGALSHVANLQAAPGSELPDDVNKLVAEARRQLDLIGPLPPAPDAPAAPKKK